MVLWCARGDGAVCVMGVASRGLVTAVCERKVQSSGVVAAVCVRCRRGSSAIKTVALFVAVLACPCIAVLGLAVWTGVIMWVRQRRVLGGGKGGRREVG